MKTKSKYDANFTAGGILYQEFLALSGMLLEENFKELLNVEAKENKFIGIAIESSRKRIIAEIKRRYEKAPNNFWINFLKWNEAEQKLGLFYLCLKSYPMVLDVHLEVVVKKFRLGLPLNEYDIQMRFDEIASQNDDVGNWADITMYKLNIQIRKALKDTNLYDGKTLHKPNQIGSAFLDYFKENSELWFLEACFIDMI